MKRKSRFILQTQTKIRQSGSAAATAARPLLHGHQVGICFYSQIQSNIKSLCMNKELLDTSWILGVSRRTTLPSLLCDIV